MKNREKWTNIDLICTMQCFWKRLFLSGWYVLRCSSKCLKTYLRVVPSIHVLKVKKYIQVGNTNEKDELQLVRGRKSQLYPSASKSRKGRVFAVFWWKLYVTRILSWRGDWRAANQVLNLQPHLLLPLSLSHLPAPPPTPLFWDLLFNYFPPFSIQTLSWNFQGMEIFHK